MNRNSPLITGIKIICVLVLVSLLFFGGLVTWLTVTEYKPAAVEPAAVRGNAASKVSAGQPYELYSWNIGYAGLGADQDFFMDGGKMVRPASSGAVERNMWAIQEFLASSGADFVLLQEVDADSYRTYGLNEVEYFADTWNGTSAYAANYRCKFVPYPVPQFIGRVESGLVTLNTFNSASPAERMALPVAFNWPVRLGQLKRCLLVERLPLQEAAGATGTTAAAGSAKELVLVNLHLEAYDSGEGRVAQTKILIDFLSGEYAKGNYCIAGGDFNQNFPGTEENYPLKDKTNFVPGSLDPAMLEGWTFAADISSPSCRLLNKPYNGDRGDTQFYVIDGFLVSPNITVVSTETIDLDFRNSDHNPVKLTFSLK